jgi:putative ABC transport system permease protein
MEISLSSGRYLEEGDREDGRPVIVVNREFARRNLGDGEALGQRVEILGRFREIVGVVADISQSRIPIDGRIETGVYVPAPQLPRRSHFFAVRTAGDPTALAADVRTTIWSIDPDQPIATIETLEDHIRAQLAGPQFVQVFVFVLGGLAVILSAMGIYGVIAHNVIQERREIGIRLALGAEGGRVVGMVTRRGALLTAIGIAAGGPLAFLIYRAAISTLNLFQVELGFSETLLSGSVLVAVAVLAAYLPARRAAKVDPVQAIQAE